MTPEHIREAIEDLETCYHDKTILFALRLAEKVLKEPSDNMVNVGLLVADLQEHSVYGCGINNMKDVFKAMIEQAVKEVQDD